MIEDDRWQSFSDLFEQETRWVMGYDILGGIVDFLKGKSLRAVFDEIHPGTLNILVPISDMFDDVYGKSYRVIYQVPDELREIFIDRCNLIIAERSHELTTIFQTMKYTRADPQTLAIINQGLAEIEYIGKPTLSQLAAYYFGLCPNMSGIITTIKFDTVLTK